MLSQLEAAMLLSQQLKDSSHDADIWGEIADTHADLGDFEKAAQVSYSALLTDKSSLLSCENLIHPLYSRFDRGNMNCLGWKDDF